MSFHRDLEAAFASDIARDDVDVEVVDALSGYFSDVSEDIDAFGA